MYRFSTSALRILCAVSRLKLYPHRNIKIGAFTLPPAVAASAYKINWSKARYSFPVNLPSVRCSQIPRRTGNHPPKLTSLPSVIDSADQGDAELSGVSFASPMCGDGAIHKCLYGWFQGIETGK